MRLLDFFHFKTWLTKQNIESNLRLGLMIQGDLFRTGFTGYLRRSYSILFSVSDGEQVKSIIDESNQPDFILIDIDANFDDALCICEWLLANYPSVKVVALTISSHRKPIEQILAQGAVGYFLKTIGIEEIQTGFNQIRNKGLYLQLPLNQLYKNEISEKDLKRFKWQ